MAEGLCYTLNEIVATLATFLPFYFEDPISYYWSWEGLKGDAKCSWKIVAVFIFWLFLKILVMCLLL